jgi:hypothetical protein
MRQWRGKNKAFLPVTQYPEKSLLFTPDSTGLYQCIKAFKEVNQHNTLILD